MQVDLQVTVPEGFELTGEYRGPEAHDWHLTENGEAVQTSGKRHIPRLILRKVPKWRDATLDDLRRVMDGETVECRVFGKQDEEWIEGAHLTGWGKGSHAWRVESVNGYAFWYEKVQVKE